MLVSDGKSVAVEVRVSVGVPVDVCVAVKVGKGVIVKLDCRVTVHVGEGVMVGVLVS